LPPIARKCALYRLDATHAGSEERKVGKPVKLKIVLEPPPQFDVENVVGSISVLEIAIGLFV
jgi:hypothetical protein